MKSFSMRHIPKGHFILLKEKENKAYVKRKRAPKKPILKPFQEEQQSPMRSCCMTTQTNHRTIRGLLKGWIHLPLIKSTIIPRVEGDEVFGETFSECCSSRQTWREWNSATAVLFTICTFS